MANLETLIVDQCLRYGPHDAAESLGHYKRMRHLNIYECLQFTITDLLQIVQQAPWVQHLNIEGCALLDPDDLSCVLNSLPVLCPIAIWSLQLGTVEICGYLCCRIPICALWSGAGGNIEPCSTSRAQCYTVREWCTMKLAKVYQVALSGSQVSMWCVKLVFNKSFVVCCLHVLFLQLEYSFTEWVHSQQGHVWHMCPRWLPIIKNPPLSAK